MMAAALLCAALSGPAAAWGPKGHAIVAVIAQDRLSAKTLDRVRALLGPDSGLSDISDCPDRVRDGSAPVRCGTFVVQPDSATVPWHVLGIPLRSSPTAASLEGVCAGDCLLSAIRAAQAALRDPSRPKLQRQKALMDLVHFAGDLHQPLHCALDDAPASYRRRFGNTKIVAWQGTEQRLHHFWDQLLRVGDEARALEPAAYAKTLEAGISPGDAAAWTDGDFLHEAALESFRIARDDVYAPLARSGGRLSPEERRRQLRIVDRRLQMAGVRLAAWLEEALGGP